MKTVQSFFPTRAKTSNSAHRDLHYNLIKKPTQQQSTKMNKQQNIFRDKNNLIKKYSLQENIQRPIGGIDLFKKMQKFNNFIGMEEQSKRLQRKSSKKNIKDSKQRVIQTANLRQNPLKYQKQMKNYHSQFSQQIFKTHDDHKQLYTKHANQNQQKNNKVSKQTSQIFLQKSKTSNVLKRNNKSRCSSAFKMSTSNKSLCNSKQQSKQNKRINQQQKNYLDKMAFLNEIYYNRPLIQKFGNQYFQCMLRNRFQDEPKPAQTLRQQIYQQVKKKVALIQIQEKLQENPFFLQDLTYIMLNFKQYFQQFRAKESPSLIYVFTFILLCVQNTLNLRQLQQCIEYKPNLLQRHKLSVQGYNKIKKEQQKKQKPKGKQRWEDWQTQDAYQY